MKKLIALLLALVMVLGLAACTAKETTQAPATETEKVETPEENPAPVEETPAEKEPVTLEWYYRGNGIQQDTEKVQAAFNELLKTFPGMEHVTVHFDCYDSANYAQSVLLAQSAGQQIDILNTVGLNFANEVENGTFLALDDMLAQNETLKNELPDWLWELGTIDGTTYIVPNYQRAANMNYFIAPKEYIDKYSDINEIKALFNDGEWTVEEVAEVLEKYVTAVQAGEGETKYALPLGHCFTDANMLMARQDGIAGSYYVKFEGSDKVEHRDLSEEAIKAYEISADWYEKGLIHPDVITIAYNDFYGANMLNDIAIVYQFMNGAGPEEVVAAQKSAQFGFDCYAVALYPNYYIKNSWGAGGNGITAKCEHPEEALRLIELMTTEEGAELYNLVVYGLEGTHYEKIDDTHIKTLEYDGSQGGASTTYAGIKWIIGNTFHAYLNQGCVEGENEIAMDINTDPANATSDLMGFVAKSADVATYLEQVNSVTSEYESVLRTGAGGSDWESYYNEFIEKLDAAGHQEIVDNLQGQVDAYLAK